MDQNLVRRYVYVIAVVGTVWRSRNDMLYSIIVRSAVVSMELLGREFRKKTHIISCSTSP